MGPGGVKQLRLSGVFFPLQNQTKRMPAHSSFGTPLGADPDSGSGNVLFLEPFSGPLKGTFQLPVSKSECNRALMIEAYSGKRTQVQPLSDSADSRILHQLLMQKEAVFDAGDAGTACRFLATWLALQPYGSVLTGSVRMKQRPIGILADALRELGSGVRYLEKEGFPPLQFEPFSGQKKREITLEGHISSQFISSLLLAAPVFPLGLKLSIRGEVTSAPYLRLTWAMMQQAGIEGKFSEWEWDIPHQPYAECTLRPEADWSSAGYAYGLAALCPEETDLFLPGLRPGSVQGDAGIQSVFARFGIETNPESDGIRIHRKAGAGFPKQLRLDLRSMPDQGQTLIVVCAILGVETIFTGLETLAIKETNRLAALESELARAGIVAGVSPDTGECRLPGRKGRLFLPEILFRTYGDHRMAMALSLFAMAAEKPVGLFHPRVVDKSFPGYWDSLRNLGFFFRQQA